MSQAEYRAFFSEKRREGKTAKDIGVEWREHKMRTPATQLKPTQQEQKVAMRTPAQQAVKEQPKQAPVRRVNRRGKK